MVNHQARSGEIEADNNNEARGKPIWQHRKWKNRPKNQRGSTRKRLRG